MKCIATECCVFSLYPPKTALWLSSCGYKLWDRVCIYVVFTSSANIQHVCYTLPGKRIEYNREVKTCTNIFLYHNKSSYLLSTYSIPGLG